MLASQIIVLVYLAGTLYFTIKAIYTPTNRTKYMVWLALWAGGYLLIS